MEKHYLTQEGLEKFKTQLETLKGKRREITERIQMAKELGDLSENAEYSEAKESQAMNESEISRIEEILKNVDVIRSGASTGIIGIGSTIVVNMEKKERTFTIVGSNEASPALGKISNVSPLGKAFIGKAKGDTAKLITPKGVTNVKIIDVR